MIRILVADDHPLLRDALRAAMDDEDDLEILEEVANGRLAVQRALDLMPDVLILDLYMPGLDGIGVLRALRDSNQEVRVLVFTSSTEEAKVVEAVQAGAQGYLIKDARRAEIIHAIREIHAGRSYFPVQVVEKLTSGLRQKNPNAQKEILEELTEREKAVLEMIRQGASNAEIAEKMVIGETTVRTHVYHILQKMGFNSRSELVLHFLREKGGNG